MNVVLMVYRFHYGVDGFVGKSMDSLERGALLEKRPMVADVFVTIYKL